MTKLILKIVLVNVGLFILLLMGAALVAVALGYASKNAYSKQLLVLYVITALIQIGVNCLIYKEQISSSWKILVTIILVVVSLYVLYPLIIQ